VAVPRKLICIEDYQPIALRRNPPDGGANVPVPKFQLSTPYIIPVVIKVENRVQTPIEPPSLMVVIVNMYA
jgi:hypothetical protein